MPSLDPGGTVTVIAPIAEPDHDPLPESRSPRRVAVTVTGAVAVVSLVVAAVWWQQHDTALVAYTPQTVSMSTDSGAQVGVTSYEGLTQPVGIDEADTSAHVLDLRNV